MTVRCHDCGAVYAGLGADLVLPDQQWKAIFPEDGGILCANCICQRAVKVGGSAVLAWIDNLDYERARQQFIRKESTSG